MTNKTLLFNNSGYNIKRYEKHLRGQKRNLNINYIPKSSPKVEKEKKRIKELIEKYRNSSYEEFTYYSNYLDRVKKLFKIIPKFPREDENKKFNSFSLDGFDIPEATHRRNDYDKYKNYEIWSKDIDRGNRLIYRIDEDLERHTGTILFLSIWEHDLTEGTKSYSESTPYFTTVMQQVISTRNMKEGNISNQLKKLIEVAKNFGLVESKDYLIISGENGIDIYDKSNDEITHIEEADDGSTIYSKGK